MSDFNIDLVKADTLAKTSDFLDLITSNTNHIMPLILRPSHCTPHSKTLIDNIFTNFLDIPVTHGNLCCSLSDHLVAERLRHRSREQNVPSLIPRLDIELPSSAGEAVLYTVLVCKI